MQLKAIISITNNFKKSNWTQPKASIVSLFTFFSEISSTEHLLIIKVVVLDLSLPDYKDQIMADMSSDLAITKSCALNIFLLLFCFVLLNINLFLVFLYSLQFAFSSTTSFNIS